MQELLRQTLKRIVADTRLKPYATAQSRQIVSDNRRGRAQRKHHPVRKKFAFRRKLFRQSIQDEVEIQFSGDGDIEAWHRTRARKATSIPIVSNYVDSILLEPRGLMSLPINGFNRGLGNCLSE